MSWAETVIPWRMKKKQNQFVFLRKELSVSSVVNRIKKNGFTIFELLMALSILAVVFSLLYLTFHQSMAVMAATEDRGEVIQQGRMILERMAGEFQGAFLPLQESRSPSFRFGFVGRSRSEGKDFLDRLDITLLTLPQGDSAGARRELREVGYYLDRHPGTKGLTLFRRQDEGLDGDLEHGGSSIPMIDRVRSLSFAYFDSRGRRQKEWNSLEGPRRNQLPSRVEIHLRLEDSRGRVHDFRTQVYLPLSG